MNLSAVFNLFGATLGLISGGFFCVGVLRIKDSTIEIIATSFYGCGHTIAKELVQQKSDFIFGAVFLICSFLVQAIGNLLSPEGAAIVVGSSPLRGAMLGVGGPIIALALSFIPYRFHSAKAQRNLGTAVEGKV